MLVLRDEDGNVVEDVVSKAEAEAQAKKAADEAKAAAEVDTNKLKADLDKVNEDLKKATEGDKNWGALRTAKEELEKKLGEMGTRLDEKDKKERAKLVSAKDTMILQLADSDKELSDKIKLVYDQQTAGPEESEEDIRVRANNAYVIYKQQANKAVGALGTDALSGAGGGTPPKAKGPLTPQANELAARMGISDRVERFNKRHGKGDK